MVALYAKCFGSVAVFLMEEFVCQHGLTNMHATVIDDVHFVNFRARFLENPAYAFAKRVISHVTEVERFVRIR